MHCWRGEENGLYYLFLLKYWTVALYWTLSWTIRYIENGEHDRNLFQKWKFPNFFSGKFQYIFLGKSHSIGEGGREGAGYFQSRLRKLASVQKGGGVDVGSKGLCPDFWRGKYIEPFP